MTDDNRRFAEASPASARPPAVNAAVHWSHEAWGLALRAAPHGAMTQHLFTTSQLRLPARATLEERERAWHAVAAALGVSRERLLRVRQVHWRNVRVVRADAPGPLDAKALPDGDALASNVPGVALLVVVADCVPILVVDRRTGAAAAIHAGWRGTCAGVAGAAIRAMREGWGSQPADLVAALGPSIGPDHYEVGDAVLEAFRAEGHGDSLPRWFSRPGGRWHLDLWQANVDQLAALGVPRSQIAVSGLSTAAHPGWLESYRRDGAAAGRLIAAVVVGEKRGS
jgi:YfiH family protein